MSPLAIRNLGVEAVALTGGQSGIVTNEAHTNARILRIHTDPTVSGRSSPAAVVVVAGFQGVSTAGEVTVSSGLLPLASNTSSRRLINYLAFTYTSRWTELSDYV